VEESNRTIRLSARMESLLHTWASASLYQAGVQRHSPYRDPQFRASICAEQDLEDDVSTRTHMPSILERR
jgi:hypothetical protein